MIKEIINILFNDITLTPEDIYKKYPKRILPKWAEVTRIPPSPTWFMHIWTLYTALVNERIAHLSQWIFYLRIEDTDTKRTVEWATELITKVFNDYNILIDEWINSKEEDFGEYWPYFQSKRKFIYDVFIKDLFLKWSVYPCFCTHEELQKVSELQKELKIRPWYYWKWAKWRNATEDDVLKELKAWTPYVLRFRSNWDYNKKITLIDELKWKIVFPDNDLDIVIRKQDWLPTYHFAHIIDDFLMWTTLVIRWDEWLPSTPLHYQLFNSFGWNSPKYWHLAPIQKLEGWAKRKLSKRKDPEATMLYYEENGYPKDSILEYLINLANSNFEDWRKANPTLSIIEFPFTLKWLASHTWWALFDFQKLNNISKDVISRYSALEIFDEVLIWSKKYNKQLFDIISKNKEYTINIFNIERTWDRIRKDIWKWWDIMEEISFFFDELFTNEINIELAIPNIKLDVARNILSKYILYYNISDSKEEWFEKLKKICIETWFASDIKSYKNEPNNYIWSIVDVSNIIRLFLTWKTKWPDLYFICKLIWLEKIKKRLTK